MIIAINFIIRLAYDLVKLLFEQESTAENSDKINNKDM
jgi:hypothetical protein